MAFGDAATLGKKGTYKYALVACIDCGLERWVALKSGTPRSPRCYSCSSKIQKGQPMEKNGNWDGGRHLEKDGYITLTIARDHKFQCMTDKMGRVREHRLIMAEHLERPLETWEVVHHINGNKADNELGNLELLPNGSIHLCFTRLQTENTRLRKELARYREV